jgi:hypothetical protein
MVSALAGTGETTTAEIANAASTRLRQNVTTYLYLPAPTSIKRRN